MEAKIQSRDCAKLIGTARKLVVEIQATRTVYTYAGEGSERKRELGEDEGTRTVRDERYARLRRMRRPSETLALLYERSWEAEAILRIDLRDDLTFFEEVLRGIAAAIETIFQTDSTGRPVQPPNNADVRDAWMQVYGRGSETDTLTDALSQAVDGLKKRLRRYM